MGEPSSGGQGWGGDGLPGRASGIRRDVEAGKSGLFRGRASGFDWLEYRVDGAGVGGFRSMDVGPRWGHGEKETRM